MRRPIIATLGILGVFPVFFLIAYVLIGGLIGETLKIGAWKWTTRRLTLTSRPSWYEAPPLWRQVAGEAAYSVFFLIALMAFGAIANLIQHGRLLP